MRSFSLFLLWIFLIQCRGTKKVVSYDHEFSEYIKQYKKGFLDNPRSPLSKDDLKHLDFFSANPDWKLRCDCETEQNPTPFEMPTYSGVTRTYILHTIARCPFNDKTMVLHLYKNIHQPINPLYKNNLFLPFKDPTNGEETYGGGRYINLLVTDIHEGKITIDFNKSYNPWCAYSDGFNCPIPPKENNIDIPIKSGEKNFKGQYKKSAG